MNHSEFSATVELPQLVPGEPQPPQPGIGMVPGDPKLDFWHSQCYHLQHFRSHGSQLPRCRYPEYFKTTCVHPECPVTLSWQDDERFGPKHGHFCELYTTDGLLVTTHFGFPSLGSVSTGDLSFHSDLLPDFDLTPCSRCNGT